MINIGINRGHNSSIAIVKDGDLILHIENERLSNIKYDSYPFHVIKKIPEYIKHADNICIAGMSQCKPFDTFLDIDIYSYLILNLDNSFRNTNTSIIDLWEHHHKLHAACSFYNSGFDKALCIVKDGYGSEYYLNEKEYGREGGTSFIAEYPAKFQEIDRVITIPGDTEKLKNNITLTHNANESILFEATSELFGFGKLEAGKVMGMSAYGNKETYNVYDGEFISKNIIALNEDVRFKTIKASIGNSFEERANFAASIQSQTQNKVKEYILNLVKQTGCKNVCLSGGYFLNCVANYEYLKDLPSDIKIYVEPISSDAGTSIGAAKLIHHEQTQDKTIRKQTSIYYGLEHKYNKDVMLSKCFGVNTKIITPLEVAQLISEKNIVALYQGRSESGPRALGNRSILYDPRDPNGKDFVNTVKNREWFRPFAGSILEEDANDWFDMRGLDSSPFMMYAVNVLESRKHLIPSILHVDDTCRIQTVNQLENINYYNLIKCFKEITGIPILFNTSFNLAGDCIVETIDQAIDTIKRSNINYLYLPEFSILVHK
jgi:carbamoyltransferase